MKKTRFATALLAAALFTPLAYASPVDTLDDIHYWGSGGNLSALVIDWNDGKSDFSLAWGFRWDGAPSAQDMVLALAEADPRLVLRLDSDASFGLALYGIGHQSGEEAFGLTGAQDAAGDSVTPSFPGGVNDLNVTDGVTEAPFSSSTVAPLNSADRYSEGWNDFVSPHNRIWGLFLGGTSDTAAIPGTEYPETWTSAGFGLSDISLDDEGWYALSFSDPDWTPHEPGASLTAVPEPGALVLLLTGGSLLGLGRRRVCEGQNEARPSC